MGHYTARIGLVAALWLGGSGCALDFFPPPLRSTSTAPITTSELAQLWVEPNDTARRDLFYGVGGPDLVPHRETSYEKVSTKHDFFASSPGYTVRDANGREWLVKLGPEVRAEVLASRLVWACGYHQMPAYYLPSWRMQENGKVTAEQEASFRPRLPGYSFSDHWSWQQNPFVGTQAYRGLIVLMLMLNNWDLTLANNSVFDLDEAREEARRWYVVWDVGASFSRNRGVWLQGTRGDLEGFVRERFIDGVDNDRVRFAWSGVHQDLLQDIRVEDVRWIAKRLRQISARQWDDAFRAAGYERSEADLIRGELQERIAEAERL